MVAESNPLKYGHMVSVTILPGLNGSGPPNLGTPFSESTSGLFHGGLSGSDKVLS